MLNAEKKWHPVIGQKPAGPVHTHNLNTNLLPTQLSEQMLCIEKQQPFQQLA